MSWSNTSGNGYLVQAGALDSSFGMYFTPQGWAVQSTSVRYFFQNWPNYGELSSLYDLIKIDKVEVTFTIQANEPTVAAASPVTTPVFYICSDPNEILDNSLANVQQGRGCKMFHLTQDKDFTYTIKPTYNKIVQYTSVLNSYAPSTGYVQSNIDIPHYGIKVAVDEPTTTQVHKLKMGVKVFMSLKDVK
jgi:hypothetical protein